MHALKVDLYTRQAKKTTQSKSRIIHQASLKTDTNQKNYYISGKLKTKHMAKAEFFTRPDKTLTHSRSRITHQASSNHTKYYLINMPKMPSLVHFLLCIRITIYLDVI